MKASMIWQSKKVGAWQVWLLPQSVPIAESELLAGAAAETVQRAQAMTALLPRSEFLRSRWLLRQAGALDIDPPRLPSGNLQWPEGMTGSLSHKVGHVAGAVCDNGVWKSMGLDIEAKEVHPRIKNKVLVPSEEILLSSLPSDEQRVAAIFAIKEAVFKCVFPLGGKVFWFHDARISSFERVSGGWVALVILEGDVGCDSLRRRVLKLFLHEIFLDGQSFWLAVGGWPRV